MRIAEILESWNLEVRPFQIYLMAVEWKDNREDRVDFMITFIRDYIDRLDFKTFQEIHSCLDTIEDGVEGAKHFYTEQFIYFCNEYAQNLIAKDRYEEAVEVLAFIMSTRG